MSRKKVFGICHICGNNGKLSFEHVPPKSAFNKRTVIKVNFEEGLSLGPEEIKRGKIQQGGAGEYTLCELCNNKTGKWYGGRFVDFCYQGMNILNLSNGKPSLVYLNYLFPLPIIKQIITMFFSVNDNTFREDHQELVRFVLNKELKYIPLKYRLYIYYNIEGKFRFNGLSILANGSSYNNPIVMSEITFPPFGYVLTIDSAKPDERLFDITFFSRFEYNQFKVLSIKPTLLPTHTALPGDYRSRDQIQKDYLAGQKYKNSSV